MRLPFLLFAAATLVFSGAAFADGNVIINEIMYAPPPELGGMYNEWVELYNKGDIPANVSGWILSEETKNHTLFGIIESGGFMILARKPENFTQFYTVSAPVIETKFMLSNEGEYLELRDAGYSLIDSVNYTPLAGVGKTIERNASGWFESKNAGGTPGANNSISFVIAEAPEQNTNATPEEQTQAPPEGNLLENISQGDVQSTPSFGSPGITFVKTPSSMRFGDYAAMQVSLFSGDTPISEGRLVAYIFSPHWISRDLSRDDSTLRNTPYLSGAAAWIYDMQQNSTAYFVLPLFLKCNKEKKFPDGAYFVRARLYAYENGSWSSLADKDAAITVSGENNLCAEEVVYVNVTSKCPACPKEDASLKASEEKTSFIAGVPNEIFIGENFTSNITIINPGAFSGFVEIYSYIHDHEKLLSQGFDGTAWRNTWAANSKKIEILPAENASVFLSSMPKNTTLPGVYSYKIILSDMNTTKTLKEETYPVRVNVKPNENRTAPLSLENSSEEKSGAPTGLSVSSHKKASFFERLKNWVREIFD